MQQWEYKQIANVSENQLNDLGRLCWELVTIKSDTWWIFKRPLKSTVRLG